MNAMTEPDDGLGASDPPGGDNADADGKDDPLSVNDEEEGDDEDACIVCSRPWRGDQGWPLCDSCNCPVCAQCVSTLKLSVSDLFYCPSCAGSSNASAAASVGGAVATATLALRDLPSCPTSLSALRRVLTNLRDRPDEIKYRRLRLANAAVRRALTDVPAARRCLEAVGFVERLERDCASDDGEMVLLCDASPDPGVLSDLLAIIDALASSGEDEGEGEGEGESGGDFGGRERKGEEKPQDRVGVPSEEASRDAAGPSVKRGCDGDLSPVEAVAGGKRLRLSVKREGGQSTNAGVGDGNNGSKTISEEMEE